jgi:predicted RNA-binding protein with RPS1 domain
LKFQRYIKLKFKYIDNDNIKQSKVEIIDFNPFLPFKRMFIFEQYFIGQILTFNVLKYDKHSVVLEAIPSTDHVFIVLIREIAYKFVENIGDFVSVGQQVKAKIIGFDKRNRKIYCSIKALQKKEIKRNITLTDQEVLEKIKLLQEVLSTKK